LKSASLGLKKRGISLQGLYLIQKARKKDTQSPGE